MKVRFVAISLALIALLGTLTACWPLSSAERTLKASRLKTNVENPPVYGYRVVNVYPHDPEAFTQGLVYEPHEGVLYEGTGLWGRSSLRRVDLKTGEVLQIHELPEAYFGEGIALWDGKIVQLTWRSRTGFVYDRASFALLKQFRYETEGWGITSDVENQRLIMSDGSSTLYFWNPETFEEIGRVEVRDRGEPVVRLNELELIGGWVWANVWQTDRIAVIDPQTGRVGAWLDLRGLLPPEERTGREDVLNGIAYDPEGDRLFVTGKLWPKLFEIEPVASD